MNRSTLLLGLLLAGGCSTPARSQTTPECGGDFIAWLNGVGIEARATGVSESALARLNGVLSDPRVLSRDRAQGVFTQDWLTFAGRMVNGYRLREGGKLLTKEQPTFALAEQTFGVPGPVIAGFWGLETDFGAVQGDFDTIGALATLAHDCRRPELFRPQLLDALRLLDQGWLPPEQLIGAWAGEIGQVQLLPSDYLAFGTDGDGDGRVDLRASRADVILTAARFIRHLGWRPGEPWLEQVQLPAALPWQQVGAYARSTREQWAAWGIRKASGDTLERDGLPAALLLPMGRHGPAFLAYPNFDVYLAWNQSLVYATTAAYFATRLAGAPKVQPGTPDPGLSAEQMRALQQGLAERGHDVGEPDGILGAKTRAAVRAEQLRLGLPADAWPTPALLDALQANADVARSPSGP